MYKKYLLAAVIGIFMLGLCGTVQAEVLDFEGLTTSTTTANIPLNYGGFVWDSNADLVHDSYYLSNPNLTTANTYASPSGDYALFNGNADPAISVTVVTSDTLFDFTGAYVTAWADGDDHWIDVLPGQSSASSLTVSGYRDTLLVDSVSMALSANSYDWLEANLMGVDTLIFEGQAQAPATASWWLMDDFTYEAAVVPEPISSMLFIIGGATLGFRRFRKKSYK